MSKTIKRRNLLKIFPATLIAPSILASSTELFGCAPTPNLSANTIILSTWQNENANNTAAAAAKSGKNIIDAIVEGISTVESDEEDQSVGKGGRPDRDGNVTLDACIMDHDGEAGGVCFLKNIEHPIQVARDVMYETPHVLLAGEGAQQFAKDRGFHEVDLLTDLSKKDLEEWKKTSEYKPRPNIENHDTIGMIGIHNGKVGGGCSTSGLAFKMAGRVGDSPIIGAGLYVDGQVGACTATGMGELMMKTLSAFLVVEFMRNGLSPIDACKKAIQRIADKRKDKPKNLQVGLIAMDKNGTVAGYSMLPGFVYALTVDGNTSVVDSESLYDFIEE